jgi:hypothetical protein
MSTSAADGRGILVRRVPSMGPQPGDTYPPGASSSVASSSLHLRIPGLSGRIEFSKRVPSQGMTLRVRRYP